MLCEGDFKVRAKGTPTLHLTRTSRMYLTDPSRLLRSHVRRTYLDPEAWAQDSGAGGRATIPSADIIRVCPMLSVSTRIWQRKPFIKHDHYPHYVTTDREEERERENVYVCHCAKCVVSASGRRWAGHAAQRERERESSVGNVSTSLMQVVDGACGVGLDYTFKLHEREQVGGREAFWQVRLQRTVSPRLKWRKRCCWWRPPRTKLE